jgi:hypothetical protein
LLGNLPASNSEAYERLLDGLGEQAGVAPTAGTEGSAITPATTGSGAP